MYIDKVCTISQLNMELEPKEIVLVNSLLDLAIDLAESKNKDVTFELYDLMVELADKGKFNLEEE